MRNGRRRRPSAVGTGLNLAAYPTDITVTGIDWSAQMRDIARRRAAELNRPPTCSRPALTAYPPIMAPSTLSCAPLASAPLLTTPKHRTT